jgi:ABC-type nitrate/sulfonate/bicarbonate transport system substrate-binding protein
MKYFLMAVSTVSFIALLFLLQPEEKTRLESQLEELEPVRLGIALQPSSVLAMIAMDQGYFRDHGLQVNVETYVSGKRALLDGLLEGKVDLVTASDTPVVFASFNHPDLRIIASINTTDNTNRIVARRDRNIASATDLRGKRIATQGRSAVHYFLHLFLLENSVAASEIDLSFLKAEELADALATGQIDAFSMREPIVGQALALLGENAVVFSAPGIYNQSELLVTLQSRQDQRPQLSSALLAALMDAETYLKTQPNAGLSILARWLDIPLDKARDTSEGAHASIQLDQALLIRLEDEARWMIAERLIDEQTEPDFLQYLSTEPMLSVAPTRMGIIQ